MPLAAAVCGALLVPLASLLDRRGLLALGGGLMLLGAGGAVLALNSAGRTESQGLIGFAGGEIQSAPLNHALIKNYSVVGLHWGLYNQRDPALVRHCHDELTALAATGAVAPIVSERIGLADVPAGLQRLADGATTGRVVMVSPG